MTPLILAICRGEFYVAQNLIVLGADINMADENGVTPLMYAVKYVSAAPPSNHPVFVAQSP